MPPRIDLVLGCGATAFYVAILALCAFVACAVCRVLGW